MLTTDGGGNTVSLLPGNGNGAFQADDRLRQEQIHMQFSVGDFNGDGVSDLVTADNGSSTASVLVGEGLIQMKSIRSLAAVGLSVATKGDALFALNTLDTFYREGAPSGAPSAGSRLQHRH